eukprot:CAMPEP_0172839412 /NCGR_PEP_ID=MMETSP1075-20121228/28543_1 /TAXON_ID=2916 /ORGANISM="Ceratium fusus, Strain PA161109" /LENGTH=56 /DNA_ID=CAMNT_0013683053 /DNA_START=28 /DNA_END=198 /DNA_ORIENTATION=-
MLLAQQLEIMSASDEHGIFREDDLAAGSPVHIGIVANGPSAAPQFGGAGSADRPRR